MIDLQQIKGRLEWAEQATEEGREYDIPIGMTVCDVKDLLSLLDSNRLRCVIENVLGLRLGVSVSSDATQYIVNQIVAEIRNGRFDYELRIVK